ncbi:hypothetical protein IAR55_006905 [Kwoniella newhampshirensis]|uniref:Ras-GAP domain-containing protein n=1 Tax=Kwoniella newhampshirensis TaxID=1651941 RepID=A0AAW0YT04_9TREE
MPVKRSSAVSSPHHSFGSPSGRSRPSDGAFDSQSITETGSVLTRSENGGGEQKVINVLVGRLVHKLPCNSGIRLAMVEADSGVQSTIASLTQLARLRLPLVVHALTGALETLSKYSSSTSLAEIPLDTLHSQLYLLHVLCLSLTASWLNQSDTSRPPPAELPKCWPDPIPLDDALAKYLLIVMLIYTKAVSEDFSQTSGTASHAPSKETKAGAFKSPSSTSWSTPLTGASGSHRLGVDFLQQHSYPSTLIPPLKNQRSEQRLLSAVCSTTVLTILEMSKCISRVIYHLSASNWPLLLARVKLRISHLTTTIEESPDVADLRLIEWANLDRTRLGQIVQEISGTFLNVKRPAQTVIAATLRRAIWNWIDAHPEEYEALVESNRKLEGGPDVLFDALYSMSDLGSSSLSRRTKSFYPLLAMLLVLCPDNFRRAMSEDTSSRNSSANDVKKVSFLESLQKGLRSSKGFEACVICYVDLFKAGTALSPQLASSGPRKFVAEAHVDLKNALFSSTAYSEIPDQYVTLEAVVAMYRASSNFVHRLWTDSGDIGKLIGVKATIAITKEATRIPWYPPIDALISETAPTLRSLLKTYTSSALDHRPTQLKARGFSDAPRKHTDLAYHILNLYILKPSFAFSSLSDDPSASDNLPSLLLTISSLLVTPSPGYLRDAAARTCVVLITHVRETLQRSLDAKLSTSFESDAVWQMLLDAGRQIIFVCHNKDLGDMALATKSLRDIVDCILQLVEDDSNLLLPSAKVQPAALVASVAGLTAIVGPDVEHTALILPSLSALGRITLLAHASSSMDLTTKKFGVMPNHRAVAFDRLSTLPSAIGRQQQQRMIRRTLRPLAAGAPMTVAVWIGLAAIAKAHTAKIIAADADSTLSSRDIRRRGLSADIEGLDEDESKEWQNLVSFLCAISGVAQYEIPVASLSNIIGKGMLPLAYDEDVSEPHVAVEAFIKQMVDLLLNSSVAVRETVKAALGSELPTSMCRVMVEQIIYLLSHAIRSTEIAMTDPFTTFTDLVITILRLQVDRMGASDDVAAVQVDLGEVLHMLAQYIQRLGQSEVVLRQKTRFCQLVEVALQKPESVVFSNIVKFRNDMLEWMAEWSLEASRGADPYSLGGDASGRNQRELDHACLKAMVPITDGLVLRSGVEVSDDTQEVVKSRMFYRHYQHLVEVIERSNMAETASVEQRSSVHGQPGAKRNTLDAAPTLAISVLSNLLSANIDVGLKHCLALGYHEDSSLRTVFMQLLTNILQQGTRFGGLVAKRTMSTPKLYLDSLTDPNMVLAIAMVDVCSQSGSEVDELSTLLFRVLESRGTLLGFMRALIEREVAMTNHESELFRANSITMRMMTIFAKTYGYNYVRATLQPMIHSLIEKPVDCSFELDPSKASSADDIDRNANHLRLMCQALLDMICSSAPRLPLMFRALCHHIWEVVDDRFPDSRHSAVGSFIFLRFFCPAIVSPESIDLDVDPDTRETRRALLLITKVIQNLANNVVFKEPHMKVLNSFLSDNIRRVTKFLSDIAVRPRTVDVQAATKAFQNDIERSQDADGDDAIIHRFVFKHQAKLEKFLSAMPKAYRHDPVAKSPRTEFDGKAALDSLRTAMKESGPPADTAPLDSVTRAQVYNEFMRHHQGRNTDSVAGAFYEGPASQNGRRLFYFIVSRVAVVDYDLLAYSVFQKLDGINDFFDLIIDLTDFSPATELPIAWLRRSIQMCPPSILSYIHTMVLYNPNSYARRRSRRVISDLLTITAPIGKNMLAASSPSELGESIPFTSLLLPDHTMALAFEAEHVFTNLLCLADHDMQLPVVVKLSHDCLQIASWRKQDITATIKSYVIDVIRLKDIDDIVTEGGIPSDQMIIKYSQNESMTFISRKRNEMSHIIRNARAGLRDVPSNDRMLRPSDVPATLMNLALLNLSAKDETLRMGAYILVNEVCHFFKYDVIIGASKVSAGLTIPNNSLSFVYALSRALATCAPHLTLEFLREWAIGFVKGDIMHKTACVHYVGPWLSNLDNFSRPTREDGSESIKQVREIVKSLISLTVAERRRLHLLFHEYVWGVVAQAHETVTDIVVYELINMAATVELGSEKAECVGDILVTVCSTSVRGKVIARLRKTLAQTYLLPSANLTDNARYGEICSLARIVLILGFSPASSLDNQLFLPEILHVITLLVDLGPTLMRQTIYGLLMNVLQSLAANPTSGDMDGSTLQHLLKKAQQSQIMSSFGLIQGRGSIELWDLPTRKETDLQRLDKIEEVAKFLGEVLAAGAVSMDCANAWRARWMGLVAATCFQHNPATQPQAFTVLGYLASDEVDDDLVYQILVAMSTVLSHFTEGDSVLIISMLRCLSRIIPGLLPDSRYAVSLFWLAVGILQLGYIPIFASALELMITALRSISSPVTLRGLQGLGPMMMDSLLEARRSMADQSKKLDQVCGISFETDVGFSLTAIIYKGIRHPATLKVTVEALMELLKLSSNSDVTIDDGEERPTVAQGSVAYFVGLLSISASQGEDVKKVFEAAGLSVDSDEVDLSEVSVFDTLSIPDNSTAVLLTSLIVALLNNPGGSDAEKVMLYRLLADASAEMPEVLAMAYDSLIPRITTSLTSTSNLSILRSTTAILERALADPNYTFQNPSALPTAESSSSLQHSQLGRVYSSSRSSSPSLGARSGTREQVLEELGMKGLGELNFPQVKMDRLALMAKWVSALIESFTV